MTAKEAYGSLIWKAPTLSAVVRILHNPAYAGAYVYGRSEYFSERRSPKTGKASAHVRNVAQWPVRITEHHPAYIGWEEFVKNQEQLRQNWGHEENRGVPREGRALLQGSSIAGLWPENERSEPGGEREPFALLRLRARLPRRGRKIMPVYDLTAH